MCREHPRQERPHSVEDPADVDLHQAVPVGDRGVPEVAELFDAGVVDQQAHRADVAVDRVREAFQRVGITDIAHHVDSLSAGVVQFAPQRSDGRAVDVSQDDRHAQVGRRAGPARHRCRRRPR